MCGITGIFLHDSIQNSQLTETVSAMASSLEHRGPDDSGIWIDSKKQVIEWVSKSYDVMINQIKNEDNLDAMTYYYRWNCSKECLARKGFEHQSHHRGKFAIYLRLVGSIPPPEQLIFKDGERVPKDISSLNPIMHYRMGELSDGSTIVNQGSESRSETTGADDSSLGSPPGIQLWANLDK